MSLEISLAQWSLHRTIRSGRLRPLDFPQAARREFGIAAVELVNVLLGGSEPELCRELRRRADGEGVRILLLMVDGAGDLSHADRRSRKKAIQRHQRWLEGAALLGCRAVRVNTGGRGDLVPGLPYAPLTTPALQAAIGRCAESCAALAALARPLGLRVLLENHGGLSSNIPALVRVVETAAGAGAGAGGVGTLPDFGNFAPRVDRYDAVRSMMPHAGAVSAKTFDFDPDGMEATIDFPRMLAIIREAGYQEHLGIEYEGSRLPEEEGIRRSRALLERLLAV